MFGRLTILVLLLLVGMAVHAKAACDKIVVNGASNWLPISYRDDRQNIKGIGIKVGQKIAEKLNIPLVQAHEVIWSDVVRTLENNKIDMITGAYFNQERAQKFLYSEPIFENQARVFVRKDNAFELKSLSDLRGRKGARPKGGTFGQEFDEYDRKHLRMLQVPVSKEIPLMNWLANKNVDYVIADQLDGRLSLKRLKLTKEIIALPYKISVNEVHLIFSKTSQCAEMMNEINQVILSLKNSGQIKKIVADELGELIR